MIAAILLERHLHSVANYLIVSLAVADLLVACLVMPLGAVSEVKWIEYKYVVVKTNKQKTNVTLCTSSRKWMENPFSNPYSCSLCTATLDDTSSTLLIPTHQLVNFQFSPSRSSVVCRLSACMQISRKWILGPELCDMWTSSDVLCCTASILHLVAIATDR